jgi:hypothetical protein
MKTLLAFSFVAAAALCSACASTDTTATGAGPVEGTICMDGTVLPPNSGCVLHGGVRR